MVSVNEILQELKQMFGGGQNFVRPLQQSEFAPQGQYTAPIHGTWHNSGGFTYQPSPTHPTGHMGVDMRAPGGTPVYPLTDGVVVNVGLDPKGGNVVNVSHPGNLRTYYAHLGTVKVQKGDKVTTNTVLGTVGDSGKAHGGVPHCHFQVWKDGQIQDPAHFFSIPKYTAILPEERGHLWSQEARQEANAFSMREHLAGRRSAFASEVARLSKIASEYYELAMRS